MRKFEDILRDKLYDATSDYPDKLWENISKELPVKTDNRAKYLWLGALMFTFLFVIVGIQKYPQWKVTQEKAKNGKVASVEYFNNMDLDYQYTQTNAVALLPNKTTKALNPSKNNTTKQTINKTPLEQDLSPPGFHLTSQQETLENNNNIDQELITAPLLITMPTIGNYPSKVSLPNLRNFISKRKLKGEVHCEVLEGKKSRNYISASHTSSYAFNKMLASNASSEEYVHSRHGSESKKYSFSDEVTYGLEFRNGLFAESGIRYDQINEKFSYKDPNASQTSTVITIDTLISNIDTMVVVDTVTTNLQGVREIVHHNKFKKVSVPIYMGYQIQLNKKVSLAAKAGLVLNIWSDYKGKMFDESLNIVNIEDRQSSTAPFFKSLVHSVSASTYLQYQVNKQVELTVGLSGYKYLGSATNPNYGIRQNYQSLGIFIGGKYHI